ncbi:MAG: NAD/NADP octopine/nopaline dehydrogenase family protein [Myxococcales bacterium]|nr:NAD/NADP octopine/nopaline dehydrogenase family protein [Myxococcales bacterium]
MRGQFRRAVQNRLATTLPAHGITPADCAARTGLPEAVFQALVDDPSLVPDPELMQWLYVAAQLPPWELVEPLAQAPDPFALGCFSRPSGPFTVAVVGGGNLGHAFVGQLGGREGLAVRWLVSSPERAATLAAGMTPHRGVRVRQPDGTEVVGRPEYLGADPAAAVAGAQVVLLCLPTSHEAAAVERIAPHLSPGAWLGAVPATGGFQWMARARLAAAGKQARVFGVSAIPWMCKSDRPGEVRILAAKTMNGVAVTGEGPSAGVAVADVLTALTGAAVLDIGPFLQITLNAGNQVLHPGIMHTRFAGWDGAPLSEQPFFYDDLSAAAADTLATLDGELMDIKRAVEDATQVSLPTVLPLILSIQASYGDAVEDPTDLRSTITSNRGYRGIRIPMRAAPGGYVLDPDNRVFIEDVPYGLVVLKGIATLAQVPTPKLDEILTWAQAQMGKVYLVDGALTGPDAAASGAPQSYGITTLTRLVT